MYQQSIHVTDTLVWKRLWCVERVVLDRQWTNSIDVMAADCKYTPSRTGNSWHCVISRNLSKYGLDLVFIFIKGSEEYYMIGNSFIWVVLPLKFDDLLATCVKNYLFLVLNPVLTDCRSFRFRVDEYDLCVYGVFDGFNGAQVSDFVTKGIPAELLWGQLDPDKSGTGSNYMGWLLVIRKTVHTFELISMREVSNSNRCLKWGNLRRIPAFWVQFRIALFL